MFKTNSRFSVLSEDINTSTNNRSTNNRSTNNRSTNNRSTNNRSTNNRSTNNRSTNNRDNNDRNNNFKDKTRENYFNKKEHKDKNIQSIVNINLTEENFPRLSNITGTTENNEKTYINILKTTKIIKKEEKTDIIKPGWVKIKLQPKTRQIITISSPSQIVNEINEYDEIQEQGYSVLDALVNLHEKRTNNYINNWGYDEWEKMFTFPNYDYNYFDRLDELEEEKMEKELQKEEEKAIDEEFTSYYEYNN
jgi:hypothetical protein